MLREQLGGSSIVAAKAAGCGVQNSAEALRWALQRICVLLWEQTASSASKGLHSTVARKEQRPRSKRDAHRRSAVDGASPAWRSRDASSASVGELVPLTGSQEDKGGSDDIGHHASASSLELYPEGP